MVAASGETEGLRPIVAWALLVGVLVLVIAAAVWSGQTKLYRRVPLEIPPDALAQRAQDILQSVGYSEAPVDTAMGFYEGKDFLRYIKEHDKSKTRWDNLETGAFVFWYRSSPRPLAALSFLPRAPIQGSVWTDDPPFDVSGMTLVNLTPRGRLTQLIAVPPQVDKPAGHASSPDWVLLFSAAGLDPSKWVQADPMWTPPVYSDARAAWTGSLAERPDIPMRIEAAAYRGKPVYFELMGPWTRPQRMQPYQPSASEWASLIVMMISLLSVLAIGVILSRRNLRLGRGDRRGAFRLAAFVFGAWAVAWFFGAHHVPNFDERVLFIEFLAWGITWSSFLWVLYIALEPYVRSRWPVTLISWSRLLAGGFRDPLVGRDILVGCFLAPFSAALERLGWLVSSWLHYPPPQPSSGPESVFLGARMIAANVAQWFMFAPFVWFAALFVLFLLRVLLRKEWAAAVAWVVLFSVLGGTGPTGLVITVIFSCLAVFVMIRFGLLALVINEIVFNIVQCFPLTTQGSAWYAGIGLTGILLIVAMAAYGFYTSLGGRPVFGGAILEE